MKRLFICATELQLISSLHIIAQTTTRERTHHNTLFLYDRLRHFHAARALEKTPYCDRVILCPIERGHRDVKFSYWLQDEALRFLYFPWETTRKGQRWGLRFLPRKIETDRYLQALDEVYVHNVPPFIERLLTHVTERCPHVRLFSMDEGLRSYLGYPEADLSDALRPFFKGHYLYAPYVLPLKATPLIPNEDVLRWAQRILWPQLTHEHTRRLHEADVIYLDQPCTDDASGQARACDSLSFLDELIQTCEALHLKLCIRAHPQRRHATDTANAYEAQLFKRMTPYLDTSPSDLPFELLIHRGTRAQVLISAYSSASLYPLLWRSSRSLTSLCTYPYMHNTLPTPGLKELLSTFSQHLTNFHLTQSPQDLRQHLQSWAHSQALGKNASKKTQ